MLDQVLLMVRYIVDQMPIPLASWANTGKRSRNEIKLPSILTISFHALNFSPDGYTEG